MERTTWITDRPLDLRACIARYSRWGDDPVNTVTDGCYHRVTPDGTVYRARQLDAYAVELHVLGDPGRANADLSHRLAEALPRPTPAALAVPPVAEQSRRLAGYRPPLVADPFEALVTAITAQQVNLTWATTTRRRLVGRFGSAHHIDGQTVWRFPSPEMLAPVDPAALRDMQFTMRKAEYIVGLAQAAADGHLAGLENMSDAAVMDHVTAIRGIGRWSADWLLARCLGRGHVIAAGDLGVRKAISWYVAEQDDLLDEDQVRVVVAEWGEGANWATHLLLERLSGA